MSAVVEPWRPRLDWSTPAGKILVQLAHALPEERQIEITVFGSAPLQLGVSPGFVSADVDVISLEDLTEAIGRLGLGKGQSAIYIEQCESIAFDTALDWPLRALREAVRSVTFVFPHPYDILVSKLPRLEKKDLDAFKLVNPPEAALREILIRAVHLFKPRFAEETYGGDLFEHTKVVWRELYAKEIDPRTEIITVAANRRKEAYGRIPARKRELEGL